uniref:MutL_C domain-containing protein n=1 Tax=Strongyloides venezuelensis TaxID=75913 RepID=A0A0K0F7Y2_STRVS
MDTIKITELITMPIEILLENGISIVGNVFSIDPETLNFIIATFKNETTIESIEFIPKMTIIDYKIINNHDMLKYPAACFRNKEFVSKLFDKLLPEGSNTKNLCGENVENRQKALLEFLKTKKIQQVTVEQETQAIIIAKNFRVNSPYGIDDIVCSMPHILKRMKIVLEPFFESH